MKGVLVDSNILLDVFLNDPHWAQWSENQLDRYAATEPLYINQVIYAEVSIAFNRIELYENVLNGCGVNLLQIPKEALFLAGKVFLQYRRRKGVKVTPLPDFFIGAHAAIEKYSLLTRDVARYKTYFPTVHIISP